MAGLNWIQEKFQAPNQGENLFSMQAPVLQLPVAPQVKPSDKKRLTQKSDSKQEQKTSVTKDLYADPAAFQARAEGAGELPFLADQRKGIDDAQAMFDMRAAQPVNDADWLLNPLIALTKAETGKDLSGGYKSSGGYSERNKELRDGADDIQKRRNELSKTTLDAMLKMKEGKEQNSTLNQLAQQVAMQSGMIAGMGAAGGAQRPNKFQDAQNTARGKTYAGLQDSAQKAEGFTNDLDYALRLIDNSKRQTGKLSSGFGVGAALGMDPEMEAMQTAFNRLNLTQLTQQFQGMSKSVDSDAERRAFNSQAPSISNRPEVNKQLILGAKALAMKARQESLDQQAFVENNPEANLNGYQSKVFGKMEAVVSPDGQMMLTPKGQVPAGFMHIDDYAQKRYGVKRAQATPPGKATASAQKPLDQMTNEEIEAYIKANGG